MRAFFNNHAGTSPVVSMIASTAIASVFPPRFPDLYARKRATDSKNSTCDQLTHFGCWPAAHAGSHAARFCGDQNKIGASR